MEDFEQFWSEYPRREGNPKAPARQEWERLRKSGALPDLPTMILAARAYTRHCAKERKLNTPLVAHTRTWLHQRRWEAFLPQAEAKVQTSAAVLPEGYEDAARKIIEQIGAARYMAYLGKAKWSNGGDVIRLQVATSFDRQTILINYQETLEKLTGKQVEVTL